MADANYCRREITQPDETMKLCMKPIARVNALEWCKDCQTKRLPFWPANDPPAILQGLV